MSGARSRVFVGSSGPGLPIASTIRDLLAKEFEVIFWPDAFPPSEMTLTSLMKTFDSSDFSVLVMTADAQVVATDGRGQTWARPNVVLELGISIGALERH